MADASLTGIRFRALSQLICVTTVVLVATVGVAVPAVANVNTTPRIMTISIEGNLCVDGGVLPELAFQPCDGSERQQWVVTGNTADLGGTATIFNQGRYSGNAFAWLCVRSSPTGPVVDICQSPFWWNVSDFAGGVGTIRDPGSGRYLSNATGRFLTVEPKTITITQVAGAIPDALPRPATLRPSADLGTCVTRTASGFALSTCDNANSQIFYLATSRAIPGAAPTSIFSPFGAYNYGNGWTCVATDSGLLSLSPCRTKYLWDFTGVVSTPIPLTHLTVDVGPVRDSASGRFFPGTSGFPGLSTVATSYVMAPM